MGKAHATDQLDASLGRVLCGSLFVGRQTGVPLLGGLAQPLTASLCQGQPCCKSQYKMIIPYTDHYFQVQGISDLGATNWYSLVGMVPGMCQNGPLKPGMGKFQPAMMLRPEKPSCFQDILSHTRVSAQQVSSFSVHANPSITWKFQWSLGEAGGLFCVAKPLTLCFCKGLTAVLPNLIFPLPVLSKRICFLPFPISE